MRQLNSPTGWPSILMLQRGHFAPIVPDSPCGCFKALVQAIGKTGMRHHRPAKA
jgi:hypothetical protein